MGAFTEPWNFPPHIDHGVKKEILQEVEALHGEDVTARILPRLLKRAPHLFANWTDYALLPEAEVKSRKRKTMEPYTVGREREERVVRTVVRIAQSDRLLEMIQQYPASTPALVELKDLLLEEGSLRRDYAEAVISSFYEQMKTGVLHFRYSTDQLIDTYIRLVPALRTVDPTGVFLDHILTPLREYIRGRKDTPRTVLKAIMNEERYPDLYARLQVVVPLVNKNMHVKYGAMWKPPHGKTDHFLNKREMRMFRDVDTDMITHLLTIFPRIEVFTEEIRVWMANRLLKQCGYDVEEPRRELELLKNRFGADICSDCEVMIGDVVASGRLYGRMLETAKANIRGMRRRGQAASMADGGVTRPTKYTPAVKPIAVSRVCWPGMKRVEWQVPPSVEAWQGEFGLVHQEGSPRQMLDWRVKEGAVSLTVGMGDGRELDVTVSPYQATILFLFAHGEKLSVEEVVEKTKIPLDDVHGGLEYWAEMGVLRRLESGLYASDSSDEM